MTHIKCRPRMTGNKGRMQSSSCPHVFVAKGKNKKRKLPPDTGKVSAELTKGASVSRHEKSGFYRAALNTCLSFLNEVKNLGKECGC